MSATCRFCKKWNGEMIHYATRHYAHLKCALGKKGIQFLRDDIAHPGLRWRYDQYSVDQIIDWLPERERTEQGVWAVQDILGRSR